MQNRLAQNAKKKRAPSDRSGRSDYGRFAFASTALEHLRNRALRAVQILLNHTKMEDIVRRLGVDLADALILAEHGNLTSTAAVERQQMSARGNSRKAEKRPEVGGARYGSVRIDDRQKRQSIGQR